MKPRTNNSTTYFALLLIIFFFTTFILISCDDTPNGPEDNYGRRDYEWQVDTIDFGFNRGFVYFDRIWGSSYSDVWAFTRGAGSRLKLWHFDGQTWSTDSISRTIEANQ
ncbi:MAG: hypothetical protein JW995_05430, partial [Melioribacteraceae bacterium]|nr:hypothetical protein [Melioribacteraceae bacterium]